MFQTKNYMVNIFRTQIHKFILLNINKKTHNFNMFPTSYENLFCLNKESKVPYHSTPSNTHNIWRPVKYFTWPELLVIHEIFKNCSKFDERYISTSYFYTLKKNTKVIS